MSQLSHNWVLSLGDDHCTGLCWANAVPITNPQASRLPTWNILPTVHTPAKIFLFLAWWSFWVQGCTETSSPDRHPLDDTLADLFQQLLRWLADQKLLQLLHHMQAQCVHGQPLSYPLQFCSVHPPFVGFSWIPPEKHTIESKGSTPHASWSPRI